MNVTFQHVWMIVFLQYVWMVLQIIIDHHIEFFAVFLVLVLPRLWGMPGPPGIVLLFFTEFFVDAISGTTFYFFERKFLRCVELISEKKSFGRPI